MNEKQQFTKWGNRAANFAVLEESPGPKARENIWIEVDKKLINSALYGNLIDEYVQDENNCLP